MQRLDAGHPDHDRAVAGLHGLLLGGARKEAHRRLGSLPDAVRADLDDLCLQAANDALQAVVGKLDDFRGDSRFTTWAYKFAIFEISTRLRRHAWRGQRVELDDDAWDRLPGVRDAGAEQRAVLGLVRQGMDEVLSDRQRLVFSTVVLEEVPIDVLAERLSSNRGAIYKTVHDARRKLRAHVEAAGYAEYLP
ncbi:RNA polymerase sigma factor [Patulibacter americanus]|uniref:RNA polymerase sigma factor n=1 Tax=Patulibacter americanus TaxID=588672 RepID=UPI001B7F8DC3|nr:sigma-70 family RNA polymerase sigma factor [Patulibacter americanus]